MDAYPREFVQDNVPLYVLAGMDVDETPLHPLQQNGPRIGADTVQIQGSRGKDIVDAFARVSSGQVSADSVPDASFRARFRTARMVSVSSEVFTRLAYVDSSNIRCRLARRVHKLLWPTPSLTYSLCLRRLKAAYTLPCHLSVKVRHFIRMG